MERAAGSAARTQPGDVRDVASLGEITREILGETFPRWRVFYHLGGWFAIRQGTQKYDGPESLIRRVLVAPDLTTLAEKMCVQEWLGSLDPVFLEAVWHEIGLPEPPR
jgi:hypothetical protein